MGQTENEFNITRLREYDLYLYQPAEGYRFSVDSLLLSEFAAPKAGDNIMDLGAGCGVVSLIMARRFSKIRVTAVEIQDQLVELCKKNIENNGLTERINALHADFKDTKNIVKAGSVDYLVSNPPYRTPVSGRISAHAQDALARHEILMTVDDLMDSAAFLLKTGGRIAIVYPAERLAMLMWAMKQRDIEPKKLQFIHPDKGKNARLFLLEGRRCGKEEMTILPPLFINSRE